MAAKRNAHSQPQREWIVCQLAAFMPPRDIVTAFHARFPDTRCTEEDVLATHPDKALVAPELHMLFRKERERVMDDPTSAPFAEQRARLIVLSRQVEFFEATNRPHEAQRVLRQIAEEMGVVGASQRGKDDKQSSEPLKEIRRVIVRPPDPESDAT